jgi:hypothetical protein
VQAPVQVREPAHEGDPVLADLDQRRQGYAAGQARRDQQEPGSEGTWLTDRYLIECKFHRDLEVLNALVHGRGKLATFWARHVEKAEAVGKHPLLIGKENFREAIVLVSEFALGDGGLQWDRDHRMERLQAFSLPQEPYVCLFGDIFPVRKLRSKADTPLRDLTRQGVSDRRGRPLP